MKNDSIKSAVLLALTASCTLVDNPNLAGTTGAEASTGSEHDSGPAPTSTGGEHGSETHPVLTSTGTSGSSGSTDTGSSSDSTDSGTTDAATCRDGIRNEDETDVDCGGQCGATCMPGADCLLGTDCITGGCSMGLCNDYLSVMASPACSNHDGITPAPLTASPAGGSGTYTFAWTPNDGSLSTSDMAMTSASPASGQQLYTVTVDDGLATAQDDVQVVNTEPFDLQNDCTLYTASFFGGAFPPIDYDITGTVACAVNNGDFGLGMCSTVYQNTRLVARLAVTDASDNDMIGLAWGIQPNVSSFYSLSWKAVTQFVLGCDAPGGILVKRIDAPMLADLDFADIYCSPNTANSTLLLDPMATTIDGWEAGQSYTVTIDFTDTGSTVSVIRDSDMVQIVDFVVPDATFTSGSFGWTSFSQITACAGPLSAACL